MLYRALIWGAAASIGLSAVLATFVHLDRAGAASRDKTDLTIIDFTYGNGLDATAREDFYHLSQGSELLPIRWLRAMDDKATGRPFIENLDRFGLLPDLNRKDGLPVGLTLSGSYPVVGPLVGITCAACHVGEFRNAGKGIRVDGAPNMFDMQAFYEAMRDSAQALQNDPERLARFVQRLVQEDIDSYGWFAPAVRFWYWIKGAGQAPRYVDELKARIELMKVIGTAIARREANAKPGEMTTSGFGRLDAFNGTRNFLLGRLSTDNIVPLAAPVKFPPIWNFKDYEWIEWTQNTNSILERNVTETLGAGASVNLDANAGPQRFDSTVSVRNLHQLETTAYKIEPPKWPAALFGEPDAAAVARGRQVFEAAHCAGCHEYGPETRTPTGLIQLRVFSPSQLGVDASTAEQVAAPVKNTGDLPLEGSHSFAKAVAYVIDRIRDKAYAKEGVTPAQQAEMEDRARRGGVYWRDTLTDTGKPYAARLLHGVWAMAPYLHNGSVPTLYDLMLPPAERPQRFPIGHRDFDPKKVGFRTDVPLAEAKYVVDTTNPGNANTGHTFGATLSDQERWDLIEYLKTY
jgi:hypothetical protein